MAQPHNIYVISMTMDKYFAEFSHNEPATGEALQKIENHFGFPLPNDYREFLCALNGGEGFIGESYAVLWKAEDVVRFNEGYEARDFSDSVMLIGSNGASEAFAYDNKDRVYIMIPFLFEEAAIIRQGTSFHDLLDRLYSGSLFDK